MRVRNAPLPERLTHGPSTGLRSLIIRTLTPFCPQPRSCSRSRTRRRWKRWSRRYRESAWASNTGFRRLGKGTQANPLFADIWMPRRASRETTRSCLAFLFSFLCLLPWDSASELASGSWVVFFFFSIPNVETNRNDSVRSRDAARGIEKSFRTDVLIDAPRWFNEF